MLLKEVKNNVHRLAVNFVVKLRYNLKIIKIIRQYEYSLPKFIARNLN